MQSVEGESSGEEMAPLLASEGKVAIQLVDRVRVSNSGKREDTGQPSPVCYVVRTFSLCRLYRNKAQCR